MHIKILKPGLLSTLQDMGRQNYLAQAVPVSGAMDTLSARLANIVVGNDANAAVIEFTYADAAFFTETDLLMAYTGGGATLTSNEKMLPSNRPLFLPAWATIKLINNPSGMRTYLAVAGGWDVPETLGSKSTFLTAGFGGLDGRALKSGDILKSCVGLTETSQKVLKKLKSTKTNYPAWSIALQKFSPADRNIIRIVPANEFNWFEDGSIADFLSVVHTIAQQSDRMGYQLNGPVIERVKNDELLSTAVSPGTIQVTGRGSLILLMADCQTTGGYPRIAQVAAVDMPLCAQLKPGDGIYFNQISKLKAEMLYIEREQQLQQLTTAVQAKFL